MGFGMIDIDEGLVHQKSVSLGTPCGLITEGVKSVWKRSWPSFFKGRLFSLSPESLYPSAIY